MSEPSEPRPLPKPRPKPPQANYKSKFQVCQDYFAKRLEDGDETGNLHEHQIEALLTAEKYLRDGSNQTALIVLPTGCGKSGIAVLAPYVLGARKVLVVTPSITITKQLAEDITDPDKSFIGKTMHLSSVDVRAVLPSNSIVEKTNKIISGLSNDIMIANAHKFGGKSRVKIKDIPRDIFDLVIVDEAHHYPANTWRLLVDHFNTSRRIFLTATNLHRGKPILDKPPCFEKKRDDLVAAGIIRKLHFDDDILLEGDEKDDENEGYCQIARKILHYLQKHDGEDGSIKHQAMVLATIIDEAEAFRDAYNDTLHGRSQCGSYTGLKKSSGQKPRQPKNDKVLNQFDKHELDTLVIVGKLLEGYDNKHVSVVAIVRHVSPESKVLFTQFVGRAVRKAHRNDPVCAVVLSRPIYNQKRNFENFDKIAEQDPGLEDERIAED